MKRIFAACFISVFIFCGSACASDWTSYFQVDWKEAGNYISSFFESDKKDGAISDDEVLPPHLTSEWDKLTGNLTDALKLRDKNDNLPKSSWLPFTEDQESNAKKINKLLDVAMKI